MFFSYTNPRVNSRFDEQNNGICVKTLHADLRSSTADVAGLAIIMVDTIKAKTTAIVDEIKVLLGNKPDAKGKKALKGCLEVYENGVLKSDIPSSMEALQKGNPKFGEKVLNDAAIEAESCERSFGGASPIIPFRL